MDERERKIRIERIERAYTRMGKMLLDRTICLQARFALSDEPVPFGQRLELDYQATQEGKSWGKQWQSAWFVLEGSIPEGWAGEKVVAEIDLSGEALVFDASGRALQGLTNGSIFDPDFARTRLPLFETCAGGEQITLWVDAAANSLFGVFTESDPGEGTGNRYGQFDARVEKLRLGVFDHELWQLWLDLRIVKGLIQRLPAEGVRHARLVVAANEALDRWAGAKEGVGAARRRMHAELSKPAHASALRVTAVGHAHIDTAWLWPVRETIRKCARTFASQLALLERDPEYCFGASQPQHYAFVREHYPELYARVRQAVANGRWEVQGATWVEPDCNLISGESLVRQILHGKNFFRDEFDVDVDQLWLPDVFGYSAALPQLLRRAGVEFFLTQKLSWNQYNEFPHHTFRWRGLDGSEVLVHFPPENTYNSQLDTEFLVPAEATFRERGYLDEFLSLFGVGDGGGGPHEENLELGRRMADLEGAPRVRFGRSRDFFHRLRSQVEKLPVWEGELYLELHRGTYTTQARIKRHNRKMENRLRTLELLYSSQDLGQYPLEALDRLWKMLLKNQFHDILPGSSITRVYTEAEAEFEASGRECEELLARALPGLFDADGDSLVLFNQNHHAYLGPVMLPEEWRGDRIVVLAGEDELPIQFEPGRTLVEVQVPAYGFATLTRRPAPTKAPIPAPPLPGRVLENELICYEIDEAGRLSRAYHKGLRREMLAPDAFGNVLSLYEDRPNDWDAWDIDFFYEGAFVEAARLVSMNGLASGEICAGIELEFEIGRSRIHQELRLARHSTRLDFVTEIEWREKHRMLRVRFDTAVRSAWASFDVQFGHVQRPTHRNTSWDRARFEVVAHRYADLSCPDFGVALLNDCKYGYKVHENCLDLNLLRSPNYPDPDADQGRHEFIYALYPHAGDLVRSRVEQESSVLNRPLEVFAGYRQRGSFLPVRAEGKGLRLETIKRAEKRDSVVIRLVELAGHHSRGTIVLEGLGDALVEVDLLEWQELSGLLPGPRVEIELSPFAVRTFKIVDADGPKGVQR